MTKIKKINITNFKAITALEADFNGATAIITGRNNSGKTSFLRGIPDRIRGEKPELVVRHGEKDGIGTLELTTGEKFQWEFDATGKDKLIFITKEGYKTAVTKAIAAKFFPPLFDIDKFVQSQPKAQQQTLQQLVGLDFSLIDQEYKEAYDARTLTNKQHEAEKLKLASFNPVPKEVNPVDITALIKEKEDVRKKLNEQYSKNRKANETLRNEYEAHKLRVREECEEFNDDQSKAAGVIVTAKRLLDELKEIGYEGTQVQQWIDDLPLPKKLKDWTKEINPEPEYVIELPDDSELKAIDEKINNATELNLAAQNYQSYLSCKQAVTAASQAALDADVKVKDIATRKAEMVKSARFPSGITLSDDGILVDGYPLDRNQISTSKYYTAALRLASLNIGDVRTLYFDASPLDKATLTEINEWAKENDLQLLIERPDFEGGEIKYELITQN